MENVEQLIAFKTGQVFDFVEDKPLSLTEQVDHLLVHLIVFIQESFKFVTAVSRREIFLIRRIFG